MSSAPPGRLEERELLPEPVPAVSVYVHIPFCSKRCNYCDFYFETTRSPRVIGATLDGIVDEAAAYFDAAGRPRVKSLYFGGGTPSVIPPPLLDEFIARLDTILSMGTIECTFEANPESVSPELLDVLRRRGVNRVSLGVQSFDDRLLRALTRRADREGTLAALRAIDEHRSHEGGLGLNVDLMTGIPGQTAAMVRSDIETALAFHPDHFSVYSLTVEEHTPLQQAVDRRIRRMPPAEHGDALWLSARRRLDEEGFEWYEISNFARPAFRSVHNLAYWRLAPYVGLGPGAVSTLPMRRRDAPEGPRVVTRLTNPNLFLYGSHSDRGRRAEVELLDPASFLFEHFITGLRTSEGVSLPHLAAVFGVDLSALWGGRLAEWAARGVAEEPPSGRDDGRLVLTAPGRLALNRHLIEIRSWIDELAGRGELPPPLWPAADEPPAGGIVSEKDPAGSA